MKRKKAFSTTIICLMISSIVLSLIISPSNKQSKFFNVFNGSNDNLMKEIIPVTSNGEVSYSDFYQNTSIIRRDFESIYFEVNVSDIEYANETHLQISFTNNSIKEFNMTYTGEMLNFTYEYKPKGDAPLGFQRVRFLIYNETDDLINTEAPYHTNFTIRSTSMVGFNSSEYFRGDGVLADIAIDGSDNYEWKITVVNSTDESKQHILEEFTNNPFQISFIVDENYDQIGTHYYVAVNMTEDDGTLWDTWNVDYFGFLINNSAPIISNIEFNPSSVYRAEFCTVTLNVSDIESDVNDISVDMIITDTFGGSISGANPVYDGQDNIFKGNFTVSGERPKGNYNVEFIARDGNWGVSTQNTNVLIKNNPPEIDGYEINDIDTDERISVPYGDDLEFDFDVSDVEGISYVTVKLIMEDAGSDDEDEYEVSIEYEDEPELTIRTEDLTAGTWTVYVSVTDTDGETTDLDDDFDTGPQQITIIPDLLSDTISWVMLVVGLIIGIIAGIGLGYRSGKSKYAQYKPVEEKMPSKKILKTDKKPSKKKISPTKPKPVEKEVETVPEREEPKKPTPKRKIKRKL